MTDFTVALKNLETTYMAFSQEVGRLEGQKNLLSQQLSDSKIKIDTLETQKINETKAVELLHLVQRSTRDKIKAAFEQTVTFALRSVYQKDYKFLLEFTQRGNLGELYFKLKSPENKDYLDLEDCTAGGSEDIISLALRFVLLQVITPRPEGFVFLDEPGKMLRGKQQIQNLFNFYNSMSEKFGRQLIIIPAADNTEDFISQSGNAILIGA